jgi:type VI secretion system protein ImpA
VTDFDRFVAPIDGDSPCGPDCEYDNDFLALSQAVVGKAEQQFGATVIAAVEPDWREVDQLCQALFSRTKDLRILAWLTLANTHLHGVVEFAAGLKLALTFCEQYWDSVHPRIDVDGDSDPYLRMNAIAAFSGSEFSGEDRLIQALRQTTLMSQPIPLRYRDFELAFSKAPDATYSIEQITPILTDALAAGNANISAIIEAYESFQALRSLLDERISAAEMPDLDRLASVLKPVAQGLTRLRSLSAPTESDREGEALGPGAVGAAASASGVSGAIQSREDVRRALDRICEYLERHEPSNPASLFARRAQRMLNMPFLDLMRELSPDSLQHLETLTGAQAQQQNS